MLQQGSSWNSRKLLQLRHVAYQFIKQDNEREVWSFLGNYNYARIVWNEIRPKRD